MKDKKRLKLRKRIHIDEERAQKADTKFRIDPGLIHTLNKAE